MSFTKLLNNDNIQEGEVTKPKPPGFFDVFSAAREEQVKVSNYSARNDLLIDSRIKRDKEYRKLTGRSLYDDIKRDKNYKDLGFEKVDLSIKDTGQFVEPARFAGQILNEEHYNTIVAAMDDKVKRLRKENPVFNAVKTEEEILLGAKNTARAAAEKMEIIGGKAEGVKGFVGALAGSMSGALQDQSNLLMTSNIANMGYSIVKNAARGAESILKGMTSEFVENSLQEVAEYEKVKTWKEEIGSKYTGMDLVVNMFTSGFMGAGLRGTLSLGAKGVGNIAKRIKGPEGKGPSVRQVLEESKENMSRQEKRAATLIERKIHYDEARVEGTKQADHAHNIDKSVEAISEGRALKDDELIGSDSDIILKTEMYKDSVIDNTIQSRKIKQSEVPVIREHIEKGEAWRVVYEDNGKMVVDDFFGKRDEVTRDLDLISVEPIRDIPIITEKGVEYKRLDIAENPAVEIMAEKELKTMLRELPEEPDWLKKISKQDPAKIEEAITKGRGKLYRELKKVSIDRLKNGYQFKDAEIGPNKKFKEIEANIDQYKNERVKKYSPEEEISEEVEEFLRETGFIEETTLTGKEADQYMEAFENKDMLAAEQKVFDDIAKNDPEFEIEEGVKLKDVKAEIETDKGMLKAITSCSLGD